MGVIREKMFRAWSNSGWLYFRIGNTMGDIGYALYHKACEDGAEFFEYINRTDKVNEKIFEGHICNIRRRESKKWEVGEIICCHSPEDGFHVRCYWGKKSVSDYYGVRFCEIAELEVIGSTTESPELLEE